ncbi:MAG: hypothetical protein WD037_05005 [Balneolales bacterium]
MKKAQFSYRFIACGLVLILLASFSMPTATALAMADHDCHEDHSEMGMSCEMIQDGSHGEHPTEKEGRDHSEEETCEACECELKPSTDPSGTITLDRAQINKVTAIVAAFVVSTPEPVIIYSEKVQDYTTLYSDSSPIYLKNRVLLN